MNGFGVLRATVKPSRARLDYHISVMFMIFRRLIPRCLHAFFMIVVLLSYIGLSLRQTIN